MFGKQYRKRRSSEEEKEAWLEIAGEVTLLSILVDKGTLSISVFILLI